MTIDDLTCVKSNLQRLCYRFYANAQKILNARRPEFFPCFHQRSFVIFNPLISAMRTLTG